ncbi:MAG: MerR family transcriptional regulator [Clostridiales Family XIII bacterium]|nr:MerR family transcriptional regulator [Clostridiales Family XIII bacterium]
MLSISKFSQLTGICRSTLIYYDEIGLFAPASRGTNNYRYYSHQQIITVNLINVMRDLDVPVKVIRELVRKRTPQSISVLLAEQERELKKKIHWLRDTQNIILTLHTLLESGMAADESRISVCETDKLRIILGPENDFGDGSSFYNGFLIFCAQAKAQGVNLNYPIGGYFDDINVFLGEPSRPTRFFFINPEGSEQKPAGRYLTGYTRGYYGQTNDLPERMKAYARRHKLVMEGPVYNIYLFDEISISDPNRYLLQVTVRVV